MCISIPKCQCSEVEAAALPQQQCPAPAITDCDISKLGAVSGQASSVWLGWSVQSPDSGKWKLSFCHLLLTSSMFPSGLLIEQLTKNQPGLFLQSVREWETGAKQTRKALRRHSTCSSSACVLGLVQIGVQLRTDGTNSPPKGLGSVCLFAGHLDSRIWGHANRIPCCEHLSLGECQSNTVMFFPGVASSGKGHLLRSG